MEFIGSSINNRHINFRNIFPRMPFCQSDVSLSRSPSCLQSNEYRFVSRGQGEAPLWRCLYLLSSNRQCLLRDGLVVTWLPFVGGFSFLALGENCVSSFFGLCRYGFYWPLYFALALFRRLGALFFGRK